ncbi:hypothetical protein, partial [Actinosynnema sp. NPDC023926]|uniref:hypothetical protein n=1 Tax=Actinosynnema sp. NPDC023926 TaxID=3157196 RepID=UPI0033C1695F
PVRVEQVLKTLEDNVFQRTLHRFTDWNAPITLFDRREMSHERPTSRRSSRRLRSSGKLTQ